MGNQKFVRTPAHSKAARRPTASANPLCTAATSFLANLANSQYVHTVSHAHTHTIHGYTAIPTLDHKLYEGASRSCDVVLGFFLHGCVCVQCCGGVWRRILLQILQEAACRFFVMFFWQGGYRNYPSSI